MIHIEKVQVVPARKNWSVMIAFLLGVGLGGTGVFLSKQEVVDQTNIISVTVKYKDGNKATIVVDKVQEE